MKTLYIDTSSNYLYTAIIKDDSLLCEVKKELGHRLSEEAMQEISLMFQNNNITPREIEKIIVVNGPGSFTGIRIGITIAKVYAWSLNIPIITISSLEAMSISSDKKTYKVPVIDARREYVYAAIFDQDENVILKQQHIKINDLNEKLKQLDNYIITTNDEINSFEIKEKYNPDILKIVNKLNNRQSINPHNVNPEYLKKTEAEELKDDNRV